MSDFHQAHDPWTEPGRSVAGDGRITYAWPPAGRFAALWARFNEAFDDEEKSELLSLLTRWNHAESTLVAYTDENGNWHDVEPDWADVEKWLR